MTTFVVGCDLASRVDYLALVVNEPAAGRVHVVRHIERSRGLAYPLVAERLRILVERLRGSVTLAIDATGLGIPVLDYLRSAELKARLVAITTTSGNETRSEGTSHFVPKRTLVSTLALALETGRLRLSKSMRHAEVLERELSSYTQTLTASGHDSYSAPSGQHDDVLSACALSVWLAEHEAGRGSWDFEPGIGSRMSTLKKYW